MHRSRILGTSLMALLALSVVTAPVAFANGRPLKADLTGAAEVPGPGDPDGSGTAKLRLNQGKGRICYKIQVNDIAPATAAHIHAGAAGVPGGVVVTLGTPDAITGYVEGCVEGLDKWLVKAIRKHAADYYVNVHNAEYAAGAVRGQLAKFAPGQP